MDKFSHLSLVFFAAAALFFSVIHAKIKASEAPVQLSKLQFTEHPRSLYTAQELAQWKTDPARSNELAEVFKKADRILDKGVTPVPEKEGQWIFYYACPKDNADLKPETPERHVCPVCKTVYQDERTAAAYRTVLNYRMEKEIAALALAYALSGEARYASPVRKALLDLAGLYPQWGRHDRWGRHGLLALTGGRRYCQLLDEALGLITLSQTYDLASPAPCFSSEDRKKIEDGLIRYVAREIQGREVFAGSRNNHQTWFNASYAVAGLVLADSSLMERAITGKAGLLWQLKASVTSDGLWYEGAFSYHFYALEAIKVILEAATRAGLDFSENAGLKSLWLGPVSLAWPNGSFPVLNDGDQGGLFHHKAIYEWGANYFKDPALATIGSTNASAIVPSKSVALTDIGLAVLRRGSAGNAVCAILDYGEHGGHHGHPDKLNLMLYARNREFFLDPGRLTYSVPEHETWCRTTVAHNTLVINEHNQAATTGELWSFTNHADYAACLAATDKAYPGWELKRFLILTDGFLLDVFAVHGRRDACLDWFLHVRGKLEEQFANAPLNTALGCGPGYQHLRNSMRLETEMPISLAFSQGPNQTVRVILPFADADNIFVGAGIGYSLKDEVPFVLRRRRAASSLFVSLYDFSDTPIQPQNIRQLSVFDNDKPLSNWDAVGLEVQESGGTWRFGVICEKK